MNWARSSWRSPTWAREPRFRLSGLDWRLQIDRRRRGQAVFEFVLMLPIFIAWVLLAVDFGIWMHAGASIGNAVREGARFAAVRCASTTCGDGAAIKTLVVQRSSGIVDAGSEIEVRWADHDAANPNGNTSKPGRGDSYIVQVTHPHQLLFVPGAPSVCIQTRAEMRLELDDVSSTVPNLANSDFVLTC